MVLLVPSVIFRIEEPQATLNIPCAAFGMRPGFTPGAAQNASLYPMEYAYSEIPYNALSTTLINSLSYHGFSADDDGHLKRGITYAVTSARCFSHWSDWS